MERIARRHGQLVVSRGAGAAWGGSGLAAHYWRCLSRERWVQEGWPSSVRVSSVECDPPFWPHRDTDEPRLEDDGRTVLGDHSAGSELANQRDSTRLPVWICRVDTTRHAFPRCPSVGAREIRSANAARSAGPTVGAADAGAVGAEWWPAGWALPAPAVDDWGWLAVVVGYWGYPS